MKKVALVVAGGSGKRYGGGIPKQFVELNGLPVLMRSINAFATYDASLRLVLVIPKDEHAMWNELCQKYNFTADVILVPGGNTRTESVRNGLAVVDGKGLVAIHDGVRPCVDQATIHRSFEKAESHGSAIAYVPMKDSIREVQGDYTKAKNRDEFVIVQTPQTFNISKIKDAYKKLGDLEISDDATVLEMAGEKVYLSEGAVSNIKITDAMDMALAEAILNKMD